MEFEQERALNLALINTCLKVDMDEELDDLKEIVVVPNSQRNIELGVPCIREIYVDHSGSSESYYSSRE